MSLADRIAASGAKVPIVDIERLPGLAWAWEPKTRYVPINNFLTMPQVVCLAAKWYGESRTHFLSVWDEGRAAMAQGAWNLYNEADIVVTYNGVRFDNPHLRSLWVEQGMPPPSPWKDVDLFQVNARTFGFESKSLQHLCERLLLDGKSGKYDIQETYAATLGDEKAQRKLKKYNVGDVKITEQVYDRLRGYMPNHPHIGFGSPYRCNQCGSADLKREAFSTVRAVQYDYELFRCGECGANVKGKYVSRAANTAGAR